MARTILSPGFELHEIDNSQYNRAIDLSLPNAPVCLIAGYADTGLDYKPQYINTTTTLNNTFGYPITEEERYFYNGISEILKNRGICIAAKLPYNNEATEKFSFVDYNLSAIKKLSDIGLEAIPEHIDSSILNGLMIEYDDTILKSNNNLSSHRITSNELYSIKNGTSIIKENSIRIVDISHTKYAKTDFNCISSQICATYTNDCLGIIPVITTPINAMCVLDIIADTYITKDNLIIVSAYNNISGLNLCKPLSANRIKNTLTEDVLSSNSLYLLLSNLKYSTTISRMTSKLFPTFSWKTTRSVRQLNAKYNKCIGVVVLKIFNDYANNNMLNYGILESFVGKIDKTDSTNDLLYIEDVINNNSQYINLFLNVDQTKLNSADIIGIQQQPIQSLGFYNIETTKKIYGEKTITDLQKVLNKLDNTREFPIDLVIDAGISNIALKYTKSLKPTEEYKYFNGKTWNWKLESLEDTVNWSLTLELFDYFCHTLRGDCMFIADCLKTFSIEGSEKIVNYYNQNTIKDHVLTKLKYLPTFNSSYAAGYCNWIKAYDAFSGVQYWCPPSAKVIGSYIYCSTYKHTWDAPAGTQNGVIRNVVDLSFNPKTSDTELLYINNWNYFVTYPTYGTIIEGQKTFLSEPTALDRINVRRLMLYIERNVTEIGRKYLYLLNTTSIRAKFNNELVVFLESVKNGCGISEFGVLCDDTNNTPTTIDNNELHAKIAIKPIKTIEFIVISFIITNLSTNIQEEIIS